MSRPKNMLGAVVIATLIGLVCAALANQAAPEADIQIQRANLCQAEGWPQDELAKLAFERACLGQIARRPT